MTEYSCPKCNSKELFVKKSGNSTGLYCDNCGAWIKWLGKNELRAFEHSAKQKHVENVDSRQDDIAKIIYSIIDHMYYHSRWTAADTGKYDKERYRSNQRPV